MLFQHWGNGEILPSQIGRVIAGSFLRVDPAGAANPDSDKVFAEEWKFVFYGFNQLIENRVLGCFAVDAKRKPRNHFSGFGDERTFDGRSADIDAKCIPHNVIYYKKERSVGKLASKAKICLFFTFSDEC